MSSGRTHLTGSLVLGGISAWVAYEALKVGQFDVVEGIVYGTIGGIFITPDYDLEGVTITEGLIRKIPVVGEVWVAMWYPYALLNPHRGRSHTPIGTIERQLYLIGIIEIVLIFWVGVQYTFSTKVTFDVNSILTLSYLPSWYTLLVCSLTWFLHDILHYIFDI